MIRFTVFAALLVGCNSKSSSADKGAQAAKQAEASMPTKVETKPNEDSAPYWVRVDADQLAAACTQATLPPATFRPDHAALLTADGVRVPWLTMSVVDGANMDAPDISAKDWVARAIAAGKLEASLVEGYAFPERKPNTWRNIPCSGDEILNTVVTVIFAGDKGDHVLVMRGSKSLEKALPAKTDPATLVKHACALTEKLLGKNVTIAKHVVLSGEALSTVSDERWTDACFDGTP